MATYIKTALLTVALLTGSVAAGWAQGDFDDIYYDASKDKQAKQENENYKRQREQRRRQEQQQLQQYYYDNNLSNYNPSLGGDDYAAADSYTVGNIASSRDVDEYNRRGGIYRDTVSTQPAQSQQSDNFAYTRRIERFHNADIIAEINDPVVTDYYYSSAAEPEINIYINPGFGGWYSPGWAWNYGWYSPWAWNAWSWAWGPSWTWGPSWSWSWGCGPGYWGPSWSWGWGPGWGWTPGYWGPGYWGPGYWGGGWAWNRGTYAPNSRRPTGIRNGYTGVGSSRPSGSAFGNRGNGGSRYGYSGDAYNHARPGYTPGTSNGGRNPSYGTGTPNNRPSGNGSYGTTPGNRNNGGSRYNNTTPTSPSRSSGNYGGSYNSGGSRGGSGGHRGGRR